MNNKTNIITAIDNIECFDRGNEEINILGYCFNYQL